MKRILVLLIFLFALPALAQDLYISPRGGTESALVALIDGAKESLDVAMFTFTSLPLADALIRAHGRGLTVRVYMDDRQAGMKWSQDEYLAEHGVPVALDGRSALMHVKLLIADSHVIALGSYNWTKAAERSNEEVLLILEDEDLAARLTNWFDAVWSEKYAGT